MLLETTLQTAINSLFTPDVLNGFSRYRAEDMLDIGNRARFSILGKKRVQRVCIIACTTLPLPPHT